LRRGDIWLFDLEAARGSEANKVRPDPRRWGRSARSATPVIIVSNDGANEAAMRSRRGVVTVVPVTTSLERVFPFQVVIGTEGTGLGSESKAQAEQVRSLTVDRAVRRLGSLRPSAMVHLDDALRLHLVL